MARYGKTPNTNWLLIGILSAVAVIAALAITLVMLNGGFAAIFGKQPTVAPVTEPSQTTGTTTVPTRPTPTERIKGNYRFPDEMKAVWLIAGTDYLTGAADTVNTVQSQIDTAIANTAARGFNTLLLPLQTAFTPKDDPAYDAVGYAITAAKAKGLYTYVIADFEVTSGKATPDTAKAADLLKASVSSHLPDGYFLTGYGYPLETKLDRAAAEAAVDRMVEQALEIIRQKNKDWPVGLLSSSVWAHKRVDPRGSDTNMVYEDYTDGFADTYRWLNADWFDCVMVGVYTSTSHSTAAFTSVMDWWTARAEEWSLPLFVSHAADEVGSAHQGWKAADQLAKQLLCCRSYKAWKGSAYRSYSALENDKTGSTKALMSVYDGTIDTKFLYTALSVSSPKKTTFTTKESEVSFQGSADRNFPVTVNGKEIALSDKGFFSETYTLAKGKNTFTIEHKGKTVTYAVTYDPVIIQSYTPAKAITVPGSSELLVSVTARKNATVSATLNGTKITLKESATKVDDDLDDDSGSDYCKYTGTFAIPAGKEGKEQNLGAVKFAASYSGMSASKTGGTVTVKAEEVVKPPEEDPPAEPGTDGEVLATGKIYQISADYAETFSGTTTDDYSRPINAYLPKGTTDVYVKTVTDTSTGSSYYLLGCGQRVYTTDATLKSSNGTLTANTFSSVKTTVTAGSTDIALKASWQIPFNLQVLPQEYSFGKNAQPAYVPKSGKITGEYVDITFFYTTKEPATPDITGSTVFSKAAWRKGDKNSYILRLTLKNKGYYYGYAATWSNGTLTFSFKQKVDLSGNTEEKPLKGVTILLDPGHGGSTGKKPYGTYTLDKNLYEKTMNLDYANLIKEKLEAMGATVYMTRTTDVSMDMEDRIAMTRKLKPDLMLSVHMNGYDTGTPSGASIHYFNEYSYRPASMIYAKVDELEEAYGLGNRSEPISWGTLYMTRTASECPTVLIECGFATTKKDFDCLVDPVYQEKFTTAVSLGIKEYFESLK